MPATGSNNNHVTSCIEKCVCSLKHHNLCNACFDNGPNAIYARKLCGMTADRIAAALYKLTEGTSLVY